MAALAAAALPAQTPPPAAGPQVTSAYRQIPISLTDRTVSQVLPFDEVFVLTGQVPPRVVRIEASYVERRSNFVVREKKPTTDAKDARPEFECVQLRRKKAEEPTTCAWFERVAEWEPSPLVEEGSTAAQTFALVMPPLNASRYYAFRFDITQKLTDQQLEDFRALAEEVFANALSHFWTDSGGNLNISDATFDRIRDALVLLLRGVARDRNLTFETTGFLSEDFNALATNLQDQYLQQATDVLGAFAGVDDALADRSTHMLELQQALAQAGLPDNPALDHLVSALSDPSLSSLRDTHQGVVIFTGYSENQLLRLVRGLVPDGSERGADLEGQKYRLQPATAQTLANNYQRAGSGLDRLVKLVDNLANGGLQPTLDDLIARGVGGLSAADKTELQRLSAPGGPLRTATARLTALTADMNSLGSTLGDLQSGVRSLAALVQGEARRIAQLLDANTIDSFQTRQTWYLSADLGLAAAPEAEEVLRYAGLNIYLRPVNKQVPLRVRDSFGRRFSFLVGISQGTLENGDDSQVDLFASSNLLLGVGVRVIESVRLGLGAVVFKEKDPNPLLDRESLTFTPYLSLSFDWDVRSQLVGWGLLQEPGATP